MPIHLTQEQEQRIQAVVKNGAYDSAEEALNAALSAVEAAAAPGFEGTAEELEELLMDGINSGPPVQADETFWARTASETDQMVAEHKSVKRA